MSLPKSLYKLVGRFIFDELSSTANVPCHTVQQGLPHPLSVGSEALNCFSKKDSCVTGRGNSANVLSHCDDSTGFSLGIVSHRARQPMDEEEKETRPLTDSHLHAVSQLDRVTCELREDPEHKITGI